MSYNILWWHILKYYRAAVFAAVFLLWYVLVINFDIYNFSITVSRFEFCLLYFLSTRFTLNNAGNGEKKAFCFLVVLLPCMHCFDVYIYALLNIGQTYNSPLLKRWESQIWLQLFILKKITPQFCDAFIIYSIAVRQQGRVIASICPSACFVSLSI